MKVGITGARGFLGTAIIAEAKSRRWKVVAYSRSENTIIEGVDEVRSFADTGSLDVSGLDALVHLAGEPIVGLWTKEKLRRVRDSRVDLTTDLVEALARTPEEERPKVLVSASGIGFYGNRADEVLDEGAEVGLGFIPELCREWEAAAYEAKRHGIRVVVPRIGLVLGDQGLLQKVRPVFKIGIGGKLGAGSQWMSWIHIDDIAGIFMECIQQCGLHGEVNAAAPNPVRNSEFTKIYARVLRRLAVIPIPQFILKHLPGGMGCLFLDSQRVEPAVMNAFSYQWRFPDLERALRDIEGKELPEDKVDCEDVSDS